MGVFRLLFAVLVLGFAARAVAADVVVVAADSTIAVEDGEILIDPDGERVISVIDVGGERPAMRATIPLGNSLFGPPVNIGITPDERLVLVSEALTVGETDSGRGLVPSDIVHVVDLESDPPQVLGDVTVGTQPSGMSIHPAGWMALVANAGDDFISVLRIDGKAVTAAGEVDVGGPTTHVAITPDGRTALAVKQKDHAVAVLAIDGDRVTYTGRDLSVGPFPFNLEIAPNGGLALVANPGRGARSDGNIETVSVIDLDADPIRVIDHVTVGDAPEGLAISPDGRLAVVGLLDGGDAPYDAFYYHRRGRIVLLDIDGKKVERRGELTLGGIPESLAFSADGRWLLVGNMLDENVALLRVRGTEVIDTGERLPMEAQPGAMRASSR